MKPIFLIVVFALASCVGAYARLGETVEQCNARYGSGFKMSKAFDSWSQEVRELYSWFFLQKPTDGLLRNVDISAYGEGEITVFVAFWKGKSFKEFFLKKDNSAFSDEEVSQLRKANSKDAAWKSVAQTNAPIGMITVGLIYQLGGPEIFKTETGVWSCGSKDHGQVMFVLAAPLGEIEETPRRIEEERKKDVNDQLKRF